MPRRMSGSIPATCPTAISCCAPCAIKASSRPRPAGRDRRYVRDSRFSWRRIPRRVTVVAYPRPTRPRPTAPALRRNLAAYKKKYERDPVAPQGMAAYVGMQMLIEAVAAAGSVDMEKVRRQPPRWTSQPGATRPALARSSTRSSEHACVPDGRAVAIRQGRHGVPERAAAAA